MVFGGPWGAMGGQQCYLVLIEYLHGPPWYVPAIFVAPSNGATQSTIDTARANSPPTRLLAPSGLCSGVGGGEKKGKRKRGGEKRRRGEKEKKSIVYPYMCLRVYLYAI